MRTVGVTLQNIAPCVLERLHQLKKRVEKGTITPTGELKSLVQFRDEAKPDQEALLLYDTVAHELVAVSHSEIKDTDTQPIYKYMFELCMSSSCSSHGGKKGDARCHLPK